MRRLLVHLIAPLALLALIAAACGDDESGGTDGTVTSTDADAATDEEDSLDSDTDAESSDEADDPTDTDDDATPSTTARTAEPHPGVTDDAIAVGVISLDWDALAELGVDLGRNTATDLYEAALNDINERGGVHGRMLELHVEEVLPLGATPADEACVALTEDEEVFITFGAMLQDSVLCYTEFHESAVINFTGRTEEREERARAPYVTLLATQSDIAQNFIETMESRGIFDNATIGVLGSVDADEQAYLDVFDAFVDAGYDPVPGLIGGSQSDLAASTNDQSLILERFVTEGVDVTVSVTGVPLVIQNAAAAGYETDQWVFTSLPDANELTDAGVAFDYLDGAVGITSSPVGTSAQPALADDPATLDCVERLDAATGRTVDFRIETSPNDLGAYIFACAGADILERALTAAGPELDNISLQAAFESIGDFELAGYGAANLSEGSLGALSNFPFVEFDADTGIWNLDS